MATSESNKGNISMGNVSGDVKGIAAGENIAGVAGGNIEGQFQSVQGDNNYTGQGNNSQFIQGDGNKVNANQLKNNAVQQTNSTPGQHSNIPEILGNAQNFIFSWQFLTIAISSLLALSVWFHQTYFDNPEQEQPKQNQPASTLQKD